MLYKGSGSSNYPFKGDDENKQHLTMVAVMPNHKKIEDFVKLKKKKS